MTNLISPPRGRFAVVLLGLVLAACSSGAASPSAAPSVAAVATATAAPTASPTASPSPSPSPTATPSPSPSAPPVDAAAELKIGGAYELAPLDPLVDQAFRQEFTGSLGALASLFTFGGRDVTKAGSTIAYALVLEFPAGAMSDAAYQTMLKGVEGGSNVALKTTPIAGTPVSVAPIANGSLAIWRHGDSVMIVIAPTATETTPVAKALITANQ